MKLRSKLLVVSALTADVTVHLAVWAQMRTLERAYKAAARQAANHRCPMPAPFVPPVRPFERRLPAELFQSEPRWLVNPPPMVDRALSGDPVDEHFESLPPGKEEPSS